MRRQDPHQCNFHHFHLVFLFLGSSSKSEMGIYKDANLSALKDHGRDHRNHSPQVIILFAQCV